MNMKKLGLLAIPLISISLLASCEDNVEPNYNVSYAGSHCKGASFDNSPSYSFQTAWINENEDFKITLTPDTNCSLPSEISILFNGIEGNLNTDYTYNQNDGEVTIKKHANVLLNVNAITTDSYTVFFDANGGTVTSTNPVSVLDGEKIPNKPTLATRSGYDKNNVTWYQEETFTNEFKFGESGTSVTSNMKLFAKWGNVTTYTIHFINALDDTSISVDQTIEYNNVIQRPTNPSVEGYSFTGWYDAKTEGNEFSFDTPLTGEDKEINIYAQFTANECKITYVTNGGTLGATHTDKVDYNKTIVNAPDITHPEYEPSEVSWWLDQEMKTKPFTFGEDGIGTKIKGDTILYAKWGAVFTVTLDAGDGKFVDTLNTIKIEVKSGTKLVPLLKQYYPVLADNGFAYYEYINKDQPIGYNDLITSDISVKAQYFTSDTTFSNLENLSWKTIKNIAVTGEPTRWFNIGKTKKVKINDIDHRVRIIDFNHDELKTSTADKREYASMTFEFADTISVRATPWLWNVGIKTHWDNTNSCHYDTSSLNNFLNGNNVYNKFPSDLKANGIMEEVYKPFTESVDNGTTYTINTSTTFKLFVLSYTEIGGTNQVSGASTEGTPYKFYTGAGATNANREKTSAKNNKGTAVSSSYWLRSCDKTNKLKAIRVGGIDDPDVGVLTSEKINENDGKCVSPIFCI